MHVSVIVHTVTTSQASAHPSQAYSRIASPNIYPHLISWMTFMILPSLDLSACFLLARCLVLRRGFYVCVWAVWVSLVSFFPQCFIDSGSANCSVSLPVWRNKQRIWGRKRQSEAETNTLAVTSGLVLKPGHLLEMWMDLTACTVIRAKNTSRPAYTLSSWHVLRGIFIITLINDRLSMNGCWGLEVAEAYCILLL